MTENKRFKMKELEYETYFIDSQQEYVDEDEPNFEIDGEKTLSDSQILNLLNENEQLKQVKQRYDETIYDYNTLKCEFDDVQKENERLKQEVHSLMEDLGYINAELEELEDIDKNVIR